MLVKRRKCFVITLFILLVMLTMTACGGSAFSIDCSDEKAAHVNAENAAKDEWVVTGSLSVEDGEEVVLKSNLEKGEIRIELYATSEEQSIDELPEDPSGEPAVVFAASGTDSMSATMAKGSYMIKATVTDKATGTVDILAGSEAVK